MITSLLLSSLMLSPASAPAVWKPCDATTAEPTTITWSIDTTGLTHPRRWIQQASEAFDLWEFLGYEFVYTETGGDVGVITGKMSDDWLAYGTTIGYTWNGEQWLSSKGAIVINSTYAWAMTLYPKLILAHEMGHVLGIDHNPDSASLMNGFAIGSNILLNDRPNCDTIPQ